MDGDFLSYPSVATTSYLPNPLLAVTANWFDFPHPLGELYDHYRGEMQPTGYSKSRRLLYIGTGPVSGLRNEPTWAENPVRRLELLLWRFWTD
ncbi:hypothetical protein J6590_051373 [Homalodisca vitripennis]|nr:hypothetical protein J6590_051373 [Homalodisca vitripennis]